VYTRNITASAASTYTRRIARIAASEEGKKMEKKNQQKKVHQSFKLRKKRYFQKLSNQFKLISEKR